VFGQLVFKTCGQNFCKWLSDKNIRAKEHKFKNEQKCAEICRNARILNTNEQKMHTFEQKILGSSGLSTSALFFGHFRS